MNTTTAQSRPPKVNVGLGLAAGAWHEFCRATGRRPTAPRAVTSLKSQRLTSKSGVYRLEGAAEDGSDVVAKRCTRATARVERDVHERILPQLDVPALRYHGYFEEPDGDFAWLFLEDAGSTKVLESQRALPAAWVARLHREAARLAGTVALPDRGGGHYLEHLGVARSLIAEILSDGLAGGEDVDSLHTVQALLDQVEARWDVIRAPCDAAPRTLVHGDFGAKNVRVRLTTKAGVEVVVLDWETAGWGPIAVDVPQLPPRAPRKSDKPLRWRGAISLDVYAANSAGLWDGERSKDLARLAAAGTVFRYVTSIRWAAEQVRSGGMFKPMARLRLYAQEFPPALAALDD